MIDCSYFSSAACISQRDVRRKETRSTSIWVEKKGEYRGILSITVILVQLGPVAGDHISVPASGLPAEIGSDASGLSVPPGTIQQTAGSIQLLLEATRRLRSSASSTEDSTASCHNDDAASRPGPPDRIHLTNRLLVESQAEGRTRGGGDHEGNKQDTVGKYTACTCSGTFPGQEEHSGTVMLDSCQGGSTETPSGNNYTEIVNTKIYFHCYTVR